MTHMTPPRWFNSRRPWAYVGLCMLVACEDTLKKEAALDDDCTLGILHEGHTEQIDLSREGGPSIGGLGDGTTTFPGDLSDQQTSKYSVDGFGSEQGTGIPWIGTAEGQLSQCVVVKGGAEGAEGGWFLSLLEASDGGRLPVLREQGARYRGGTLRFAVNADRDLRFGLSWVGEASAGGDPLRFETNALDRADAEEFRADEWVEVELPLAEVPGFDPTRLGSIWFNMSVGPGEEVPFCIDAVELEPIDCTFQPEPEPYDWCPEGKREHGVFFDAKQNVPLGQYDAEPGVLGDARFVTTPNVAPFEGTRVLCVEVAAAEQATRSSGDQEGSRGGFFLPAPGGSGAQDLEPFSNGELTFVFHGDVELIVGLSSSDEAGEEIRRELRVADFDDEPLADGWRRASIPLSEFDVDLARMRTLAAFMVEGQRSPTTFCIDAVRYTASCDPADSAASDTDDPDAGDGTDAGDAGNSESCLPSREQCRSSDFDVGEDTFRFFHDDGMRIDLSEDWSIGWDQEWGDGETREDPDPHHGDDGLCVQTSTGQFGAFFHVESTDPDASVTHDYSRFADGYLDFVLRAEDSSKVGVTASWVAGGTVEHTRLVASDFVDCVERDWANVRIPLCAFGADLTQLVSPVGFHVDETSDPVEFCVDDIQYTMPMECSASEAGLCGSGPPIDDAGPADAKAPEVAEPVAPLCRYPLGCAIDVNNFSDVSFGFFSEVDQDVTLHDFELDGDALGEDWIIGIAPDGSEDRLSSVGDVAPFEGDAMLCLEALSNAELVAFFLQPSEPYHDLSVYDYVDLELSSDRDVELIVSWLDDDDVERYASVSSADFVIEDEDQSEDCRDDSWKHVRVPLCAFGADLSRLVSPIGIRLPEGVGTPVCIDAVHYTLAVNCPADGVCAVTTDAGVDVSDTGVGVSDASSPATYEPTMTIPAECIPDDFDLERDTLGWLFDANQTIDLSDGEPWRIGWDPADGSAGESYESPTPFEGDNGMCIRAFPEESFTAFFYSLDAESPLVNDLSEFEDGYLDLRLAADGPVLLTLSWQTASGGEDQSVLSTAGFVHEEADEPGGYAHIRVPLCRFYDLDLSKVISPIGITVSAGEEPVTACVDAIHYTRPLECSSVDTGECQALRPTVVLTPDPQPLETSEWSSWVDEQCLAGTTPKDATYGLLFEGDQDLPLDVNGGGFVVYYALGFSTGAAIDGGALRPPLVAEGQSSICATGYMSYVVLEFREEALDPRTSTTIDLSAFEGGSLDFEFYGNVSFDRVEVVMAQSAGEGGVTPVVIGAPRSRDIVDFIVGPGHEEGWVAVSVPLCEFTGDLSAVRAIVFETDDAPSCIDAVRVVRTPQCLAACVDDAP